MKELSAPTDVVETIFKLKDVNLSVNNFWSSFRIWNKVVLKNSNLTKTFLSGTFLTIILGVYNLFRSDLKHESMKSGG